MNINDRKEKIIKKLSKSTTPISASAFAEEFSVSRQIIVGDIALLRASGKDISSTPRGYLLDEIKSNFPFTGLIACKHTEEQLTEELFTVVDYGGTIIDVIVEHSIYGQLSGELNISSRYDANLFWDSMRNSNDRPLSLISGGIHLHHIGCRDEHIFEQIKNKLIELGIAFEK